MPKVILGNDGSFRLPEEYRRRFPLCREWWLDQREGAVLLLPRQPDLHKLYVEPTSDCNLNCRTCIRNVWEEPKTHMKMETFRLLMSQVRELPDLKRIVFSGLGEPLVHPDLLEIWTSEEYCRFRNEVRDFNFPSCPDCDLRESCDLRAKNDACWGWNPSCADCLWAQDIIRCP